ncbi:hypothetical protein IV203_005939 [Nitzschia inconspicua]|uniref:Uncharacterized protein n=1 Tax=Nitzschia inconspicua TaxID=303405 RepID=A0A9K3PH04_9STRA|nr:hypothetical protein IV203_005939 [Nitzschia inconspicua]
MTIRSDNSGEDAEEAVMSGTQTPHSEEQCATTTTTPRENALEESNRANCEENNSDDNDDDDDDDVTVIILENLDDDDEMVGSGWIDQDSPEIQERRRNVLLRELQRVQRASFIHFLILCLIPTSLLFIVIATVLGEDEDCESTATTCAKEPRTFINAFTTRCVCDAIAIRRADP